MIKFLSIDNNKLFDEVVEMGIQEGVDDYQGFKSLVEEVIEGHRSLGEIHDDNPTEAMEDWMEGRWPEYQERISGRSDS